MKTRIKPDKILSIKIDGRILQSDKKELKFISVENVAEVLKLALCK